MQNCHMDASVVARLLSFGGSAWGQQPGCGLTQGVGVHSAARQRIVHEAAAGASPHYDNA
jgi:hypothetical protein